MAIFMRNSVLIKLIKPAVSKVASQLNVSLSAPATALTIGFGLLVSLGANPQAANAQALYNPIPLPANGQVTDSLTDKDIPTGSGGFARDYSITFKGGEQVVMDLTSDQFDTIITLLGPDGTTAAENDDAPDGSTNSMLFSRITKPGNYIIRVNPYAGQGVGQFTLKVTRLRAE
jgi:Bacterial pre-peptidase C-terminal domain